MTLEELIEKNRKLYRADLSLPRLVSRQPPTALDPNTGELCEEPAPRIGMAMSGGLLRFLGHPEGYGSQFPWASALWRLKARCRRTHPAHRAADRPYWRGSLCWSLVSFTVVRGYSLDSAARILRVDRDPEQTLRNALQVIEEEMDTARARAERRAREDAGLGPGAVAFEIREEPHTMGGAHPLECPRCRKVGAA